MSSGLFLYSVNTWLSYKISQTYYENKHYVWCAPSFNPKGNPPSSNPAELYNGLKKDIDGKDYHSSKIDQNRVGLLRGAEFKKAAGVINELQEKDIKSIVKAAEIEDFRPLIYVISLNSVSLILEYLHKA